MFVCLPIITDRDTRDLFCSYQFCIDTSRSLPVILRVKEENTYDPGSPVKLDHPELSKYGDNPDIKVMTPHTQAKWLAARRTRKKRLREKQRVYKLDEK